MSFSDQSVSKERVSEWGLITWPYYYLGQVNIDRWLNGQLESGREKMVNNTISWNILHFRKK